MVCDRLNESRNAAIGDLDKHYGAIAQLGERLVCIQEVCGSIPHGSTISSNSSLLRASCTEVHFLTQRLDLNEMTFRSYPVLPKEKSFLLSEKEGIPILCSTYDAHC